MAQPGAAHRPYLIDVSRLIWRFWTRRLPTGIDRVCLAYLDHFGDRAQATFQRGGRHFILSPEDSDRLFVVLRGGRAASQTRLVRIIAAALTLRGRGAAHPGTFYLNVGHTGLDEPTLPSWIAGNRLRAIFLVHDLIPITFPQYCRAGEGDRHARRMTNVLASAHGIICNSQATVADLTDFAKTRGVPMPAATAAWISGPPPRPNPGPPPLATPYFVTLGTIEGRKNHLLLLEIWHHLIDSMGTQAPTLIVIGQRGWEAGPALALLDRPSEFAGKVIELNDCGDDDLAAWIGGARALLMPSFAEGFGLPIVEALALGTPVIASNLAIFREIGGSIPTFANPGDRAEWTRLIRAFAGDSSERARQLEQMKAYKAPSWGDHFAIVDQWLATL
ncbi:MAG: glycosyltransferase family 4 protein [Pseudomonadota bacterium]|nr:glycosyltransferase family 4 protein [Pseudomonadota bacterium]